ncbi:YCF48-related protein [Runella sp.]|jgi:hypothetical protein|uniref:YCF48-related protein n=1 Tax=Runella sp. TaxID=1960881 RepID=UPI00262F4212|nr:YCF48-related protein [Runella sp.]
MKKLLISFLILLATIIAVWAQAPNASSSKNNWRIKDGKIQRFFGENWENVELPTTLPITALDVLTDDYGWAVGHNATLLRWDGERWSDVLVFTNENLTAVYLANAQEGWAVGNQGTILHWNGTSWNPEACPLTEALVIVKPLATGVVQITSQSGITLVQEMGVWKIQLVANQPTMAGKQIE